MGEGGKKILPGGGLADDGKRLGFSESALDVAFVYRNYLITREGVCRREWTEACFGRGLADDGKRLGHVGSSDARCIDEGLYLGEGFGEGNVRDPAGSRGWRIYVGDLLNKGLTREVHKLEMHKAEKT